MLPYSCVSVRLGLHIPLIFASTFCGILSPNSPGKAKIPFSFFKHGYLFSGGSRQGFTPGPSATSPKRVGRKRVRDRGAACRARAWGGVALTLGDPPATAHPARGGVRGCGARRGVTSDYPRRPQHALYTDARRCPEVTPAARHKQQAPPIN